MKQHYVYVPRKGRYVREDAATAEPDETRPAAPAHRPSWPAFAPWKPKPAARREIIEAMAPPEEPPRESVRDTEPELAPAFPVRIEAMALPDEPSRKPGR